MKKILTILVTSLILAGTCLAQDQKAQLVQAVRADEYNLESEVLARFVDLEMAPEWWALMLDPKDRSNARASMSILTTNIVGLAKRMGLGDAAEMDQNTGYKGNSPPVLGILKSWEGKIKVKIVIPYAPDDTSKKATIAGLDRIAYPIGTIADPRSKTFFFTLTFDPAATEESGTVSADGSTYEIKVPGYTSWNQTAIDKVMKRGR